MAKKRHRDLRGRVTRRLPKIEISGEIPSSRSEVSPALIADAAIASFTDNHLIRSGVKEDARQTIALWMSDGNLKDRVATIGRMRGSLKPIIQAYIPNASDLAVFAALNQTEAIGSNGQLDMMGLFRPQWQEQAQLAVDALNTQVQHSNGLVGYDAQRVREYQYRAQRDSTQAGGYGWY